jgi:hypothetical protein
MVKERFQEPASSLSVLLDDLGELVIMTGSQRRARMKAATRLRVRVEQTQ